MKRHALWVVPLALLALFPAAAQPVEVGIADWDKLPRANVAYGLNYGLLYDWAKQVLASKACRDLGMRADRFEIDEPYAVLLEPDGTVKRIVVEETKCPGIDFVVGLAVQALAQGHRFKRTGEAAARWYGGRITFAGVEPGGR